MEDLTGDADRKSRLEGSVSSSNEMTALVWAAAEPAVEGEGKARKIERAARRLGLKFRRARSFWYGEAARVDADEWRTAKARIEQQKIVSNIRRKVEWMVQTDEDFFSPEIARLERLLSRLGPVDRAVDSE